MPSFVSGLPSFPPGVARSSGDDKSIGTDCPRTERSYIGSDEQSHDDDEVAIYNPSDIDMSLIRDFEAACAACNDKREQAESTACAAAVTVDELPVQSAACAAADHDDDELTLPVARPPSLRRAVQLEKEATAKAKAAKAKDKKSKNKLSGYLPMAGAFIDEDQKKGDDQDKDDIIV